MQKLDNSMNTILKYIVFSFFILFSCDFSTDSNDNPQLSSKNYRDIVLSYVNYNEVQISHKDGFDMRSDIVTQIEFGSKVDSGFQLISIFPSNYETGEKDYSIRFQYTLKFDSTLISSPLTIRYRFEDLQCFDIDTMVSLYKYPYSSAEIFIDKDFDPSPISYHDISRNQTSFFYHNWSSGHLREYTFSTKQITHYNFYRGGSHIAANKDYVFCDIDHKNIVRFNLNTKTPDIHFSPIENIAAIGGMAVDDSILYVSVIDFPNYILTYNMEGTVLDSIHYTADTYYMALNNGILYCKYYLNHGNQISRFDVESKEFLENVLAPAKWLGGIEIYDDTFYYIDANKNMVGTVPLEDLIEIE